MSVFDSAVKQISSTGATDDAAAAGALFTAAGIYQAAPDSVNDGDVGRLRMTARRGLVAANDYIRAQALSNDVTEIEDITVSTTNVYSGFAAPTAAFFDGSDGGFGAGARWIKIPMGANGWQTITMAIVNALLTTPTTYLTLTCTVKAVLRDGSSNGYSSMTIYSSSVGYYQGLYLSPYLGGTGASAYLQQVPALLTPCDALILELTPSGDPDSGFINLFVNRA